MVNDNLPSKKQRELLSFIDGFIRGNGYGPSYREVMRALGYKSVSTVATHVDGLIARGYLRKRDNSARSLEVVTTDNSGKGVEKPADREAQAEWLADITAEKVSLYKTAPSAGLLHDIRVLLDALTIVGAYDASERLEAKLAKVIEP